MESLTDGRTIQNMVDCLPRKDFEIYDRDSRKMNFTCPDTDIIMDKDLMLFEVNAKRPNISKYM